MPRLVPISAALRALCATLAALAVAIGLVPLREPSGSHQPLATIGEDAGAGEGGTEGAAPEGAADAEESDDESDERDPRDEDDRALHAGHDLRHDWLPIARAASVDALHTHPEPDGADPRRLERPPRG